MVEVFFAETSTLLAANATINGATHDTFAGGSGPSPYSRFRAFGASDKASASNGLTISQSDDGTTWFITTSLSVPAGFLTPGPPLESLITKRYVRASYTNGAVGTQVSFNFSTALAT